jgi:DNA polymerase III sliding clamp (beta) subunit (PCNA family)
MGVTEVTPGDPTMEFLKSVEFEFEGHAYRVVMTDSDSMSVAEIDVFGQDDDARNRLEDDDFYDRIYQHVNNRFV